MNLGDLARLHYEILLAGNRSPETIRIYGVAEARYIAFAGAQGEIDLRTARAFLIERRTAGLSPKTVRMYATALKAWASALTREGVFDRSPLALLALPKVPKKEPPRFTKAQVQALRDAAEVGRNPERDLAILAFLLDTGARVSEASNLTRADIHWASASGPAIGRVALWGKGAKQRTVAFSAFTGALLASYLEAREDRSKWLFATWQGGRMSRDAIYRLFRRLGERAGIELETRVSPHSARHTHGVEYLRDHPGALFHLQREMGHETLEMLHHYARVVDDDADLDGPSISERMLGER